jgi:hypothetical protein
LTHGNRRHVDEKSDASEPLQRTGPVDWPGRIVALALLGWITFINLVAPSVTWLTEQSVASLGGDPPFWLWSAVVFVQALLVLVPSAVLAGFWPQPGFRALFTLWALAALFQLLGAAIQLPQPPALPLVWLLQLGLVLLYALLLVFIARRKAPARRPAPDAPAGLAAVTAALLVAIPWLARGAAGSPLETGVNLVLALAFGLAAALLLDTFLLRALYSGRLSPLSIDKLLGAALGAGGALLLLGGGLGYRGMMLPLSLLLASAALPAVALARSARNVLPLTLLLGGVAAAPLLFLDPRELAIALSFGLFALLSWVGEALLLSMLVALLGGVSLLALRWLWQQRPDRPAAARPLAVLALALSLGAALFFYLRAGNPGFYGERLFVVLRQQADLSSVPDGDISARRAFVYETLVAHAEASQQALRSALDDLGASYVPYYLVNGIEVEGGPLLRLWLERRPDVDRVLDSPTLRPVDLEPDVGALRELPAALPENLALIRADEVWDELGVRGAGVVVGQSDSGVQWDHAEVRDSYRGAAGNHNGNWLDPWFGRAEPSDYSGHGTHTLGTVLGNNTGVAPDATWFACANLVRNVGNTALYLDCMQFMLAPFPSAQQLLGLSGRRGLRPGSPAAGGAGAASRRHLLRRVCGQRRAWLRQCRCASGYLRRGFFGRGLDAFRRACLLQQSRTGYCGRQQPPEARRGCSRRRYPVGVPRRQLQRAAGHVYGWAARRRRRRPDLVGESRVARQRSRHRTDPHRHGAAAARRDSSLRRPG